jgi:UPF0716 protein FxsA
MFSRIVLLLLTVAVLEVVIFLKVSEWLGLLNTVAILLSIGVLGMTLLKREGLRVLLEVQERLSRGGVPGSQLAEGALLVIAGVLMVTPGFLSDLAGLSMLIPPVRRSVGRRLSAALARRVTMVGPARPSEPPRGGAGHPDQGPIIIDLKDDSAGGPWGPAAS